MGKVRLSLDLPKQLNDDLEASAEALETTKSEALRKGLALLFVAYEAKKKGQKMVLMDSETKQVSALLVI